MRRSGWWTHAVGLLCVLAPAASAGPFEERRFEVVPFAGYTIFDSKRTFLTGGDIPDDLYLGGRASLRIDCTFRFELAGGFSSVSDTSDWNDWAHASANLVWSPASRNQTTPFVSVGAGGSRTAHFESDPVWLGTFEGAVGVTVKVTNALGVRLEARDVYSVSPEHWNEIVVGGGLSFAFGDDARCEPSRSSVTREETPPARLEETSPPAPPEEAPPPAPEPSYAPAPSYAPPLPPEMQQTGTLTAHDIQFAPGTAELLPSSDMPLQRLCRTFRGHPELKIEIGVHTDAAGTAQTNLALSEQRAKAVYDWLVVECLEVNIPRFTVRGYGEQRPLSSSNAAQNRRIEFRILNPEVLRHER